MIDIDFLNQLYFENTVKQYLIFGSIFVLGLLFKRLIGRYLGGLIFGLLDKSKLQFNRDSFDRSLQQPLNSLVLLGTIFVASQQLQFPSSWDLAPADIFGLRMILKQGFALLFATTVFWTLLRFVDFIGEIMIRRVEATTNKMDNQIVPFAIEIAKVMVIVLGVLTIMSSIFNVNIAALATGLGIGGLAIAMASKESLENLLGSFTIFLDKPFTYGDIVTVNGYTGTVEKVGFRSTRIRTFDKSIVTVPNKNMVNAELDNLGLRPIRRVKFSIGVTYGTSVNQLKTIVQAIEVMINSHPHTTTSDARVRFQEFGDSSLDILVIYYVNSPDWDLLIDTRQEINFKIIEIIQDQGSDFAFPTTSVYLEK